MPCTDTRLLSGPTTSNMPGASPTYSSASRSAVLQQIAVFRIAATAVECDLPAMGGQAGRSECEYQFRRLAASDRHQHGRLGQAVLRRREMRAMAAHPSEYCVQHEFSRLSLTGIMA